MVRDANGSWLQLSLVNRGFRIPSGALIAHSKVPMLSGSSTALRKTAQVRWVTQELGSTFVSCLCLLYRYRNWLQAL